MNLENFLSQVLEITATFNFKISILLFLLCAIGEIGFSLPYILETIWLMAGYQLAQGRITTIEILYIWLIAQAGRQTGSLTLYYSGMLGMIPLKKFYKRFMEARMPKRQFIPQKIINHLTNPSPFSIAFGRLVGLRVPAALTMSARRRWHYLCAGVLLSSIIWDGAYLIIGRTLGATVVPSPFHMLLYSVGGLTGIYLITLGIRYLIGLRRSKVKTHSENQV